MAYTAWVCEGCNGHTKYVTSIWPCAGCGAETCDNCFDRYGHCKPCCEGKTDEALRVAANATGAFAFDEPPLSPTGTPDNAEAGLG